MYYVVGLERDPVAAVQRMSERRFRTVPT